MSKVLRDDIGTSSFLDDWIIQQHLEKFATRADEMAEAAARAGKKVDPADPSAPKKVPAEGDAPSSGGAARSIDIQRIARLEAAVEKIEQVNIHIGGIDNILLESPDVQRKIADLVLENHGMKTRIGMAASAAVKRQLKEFEKLADSLSSQFSDIITEFRQLKGSWKEQFTEFKNSIEKNIDTNTTNLASLQARVDQFYKTVDDFKQWVVAKIDEKIQELADELRKVQTENAQLKQEQINILERLQKVEAEVQASRNGPGYSPPPSGPEGSGTRGTGTGTETGTGTGRAGTSPGGTPGGEGGNPPPRQPGSGGGEGGGTPPRQPEPEPGPRQRPRQEEPEQGLPLDDADNPERVADAEEKLRRIGPEDPVPDDVIDDIMAAYKRIFDEDPSLEPKLRTAARMGKRDVRRFIGSEIRVKGHRSKTEAEIRRSTLKQKRGEYLGERDFKWWKRREIARRIGIGLAVVAGIGFIFYAFSEGNRYYQKVQLIRLIGEARSLLADAYGSGSRFLQLLSALDFSDADFKSKTDNVTETVKNLLDETRRVDQILQKAISANDDPNVSLSEEERAFLIEHYDSIADKISVINDWLAEAPRHSGSVTSGDLDATIKAGQQFMSDYDAYLQKMTDVVKYVDANDIEESVPESPEVSADAGAGAKPPTAEGTQAKYPPVPVKVWGHTVNIGNKNEEWRNAFIQIANTVLNTPAGQAFIDPRGEWGGGMEVGRSGDIVTDILQGASELINNGVYNRAALLRYMKRKHDRGARKKASGWKQALREYRKEPYYSEKSASSRMESILNLSKVAQNKKNLHKNLEISDKSIIFSGKSMKKQAEYNSNEFFETALKGVKDTYTRSYWSGLKGMYHENPEKAEADYKKFYRLHDGTGSGLVQDAHPNSLDIADSMGRGGRVENIVEQQNHNVNVALSMPSANFRGRHANLIESIRKFAEHAEKDGSPEASEILKNLANKLTN